MLSAAVCAYQNFFSTDAKKGDAQQGLRKEAAGATRGCPRGRLRRRAKGGARVPVGEGQEKPATRKETRTRGRGGKKKKRALQLLSYFFGSSELIFCTFLKIVSEHPRAAQSRPQSIYKPPWLLFSRNKSYM